MSAAVSHSASVLRYVPPIAFASVLIYNAANPGDSNATWIYLCGLVQLIPFLISLATGVYSLITLASIDYFVSYSLAKINVLSLNGEVAGEDWIAGSQLTALCCLLVWGAYYTTAFAAFQGDIFRRQYRELMVPRIAFYGLLLFILLFPLIRGYVPGPLAVVFFTLVRLLTLMLFTSLPEGMNPDHARRLVISVTLTSAFGYFLFSGSLGPLGTVASVALTVGLMRRIYLYVVAVFIGAALAFSIQTFKGEYREFLMRTPHASLSQRATVLRDMFQLRVIDGVPRFESDAELAEEEGGVVGTIRTGFQRVGEHSLDLVLDQTPRIVPYWEGETYEGLAYIFIPRILWPDKPGQVFYNKFGRTYGVLSPTDYRTSVALNYMAEAYMNFGHEWLYLVCLMVGAYFAFIEYSIRPFIGGDYMLVFLVYAGILTRWNGNLTIILNSTYTVTIMLIFLRHSIRQYGQYDAYS